MKYNPEKHHRHSTRLKGYDYSLTGAYFITICTHQRECIFGKIINGLMVLNEFGQIVAEEWERSPNVRQNIELDGWIVMPNHFHGIVKIIDVAPRSVGAQCIAPLPPPKIAPLPPPKIAPLPPPKIAPLPTDKLYRQPQSLGSFVAGFKMSVTKRINAIRETPGVPVWQRNYYDRIVQNEYALHQIRLYIANNPQSWQLDQLYVDNPMCRGAMHCAPTHRAPTHRTHTHGISNKEIVQTPINANNLNLYVETFGNSSHPPVLLIMGLASQCLNWFPYFYEPIVKKGYYVIRFDNRDIGLSEWIDPVRWQSKPYSLEDMAQDAVELLAALKIDKAHIVGASMGGAIAQRIAISHPQCVLSLTSMLSFADAATLLANPGLPLLATDEIPSEDMQLSFWQMLAGSGYPFDEELYKELYHESFEVRQGYNPNCIQHQLAAISISGSRLDELKRITAPTLVVHGTEDPLVPATAASEYVTKIPGAKLVLLDGVGHEIPQGASDRVHQEMFNLFTTVEAIAHVR